MAKRVSTVEEKARVVFSHFTLVLTLAFGAVTTLTLLEEPSRTFQPVVVASSSSRLPASLGTPAFEKATAQPFMGTLSMNCSENSEVKASYEHVRIKGDTCLRAGEQLVSTKVRNLSNGMTATVFHQGDRNFTTDYIALSSGENQLVVETTSQSGETRARHLLVQRQ